MHSDIRNDKWGLEIKGRLSSCNDSCAEEAWYHRNCYMRCVRHRDSVPQMTTRCIEDATKVDAFEAVCDWLENECDLPLMSLDEFLEKTK